MALVNLTVYYLDVSNMHPIAREALPRSVEFLVIIAAVQLIHPIAIESITYLPHLWDSEMRTSTRIHLSEF